MGSRLVEQREGVIENVAPVLAWVFTPLFATALLAFLGAMAWTGGRAIEVEHEVLVTLDLLVVVVGLPLYNTSARDLRAPRIRSMSSNWSWARARSLWTCSRSARSRRASPHSDSRRTASRPPARTSSCSFT